EGFDQRVGGEDLALLVENQRREAKNGERLTGDSRPLQLQARRHQNAAGQVGTQFVELLDDSAFYRSTFGPPRQDESHVLARGDRNRRAHGPTDALWTPKVAIDRLLIQFIRSENVDIGHKSRMARGKKTSKNLSAREPTFVYVSFRGLTG